MTMTMPMPMDIFPSFLFQSCKPWSGSNWVNFCLCKKMMKKHRNYPSLISPIIPPPNFSRWRNGRPERYPQAHLWRQIWPSSPLERLFEQLLCGCLWYIWGDTICSGCYVYCIGCFSSRLSRKVPSSVFPNWKCFKSFAILHVHRKQSRKTAIECK